MLSKLYDQVKCNVHDKIQQKCPSYLEPFDIRSNRLTVNRDAYFDRSAGALVGFNRDGAPQELDAFLHAEQTQARAFRRGGRRRTRALDP